MMFQITPLLEAFLRGELNNSNMTDIIIKKGLSQHIVMTGVYYKNNHPGGISAVVQYWSSYIENLQYYPTFIEGSKYDKIKTFVKSYFSLRNKIKSSDKIRILHAHTAAGTDFKRTATIVKLAKRNGLKVIIHSHASSFKDFYGKANEKKKAWILSVLLCADVLIVLSESWKQYFIKVGIPEDRIVILHNITAYPRLVPFHYKDNDKIRLLFLGEIGQRKGVFDLLRAIGLHKEELKNNIVLRIGGNKMEEKLLSTIKEYDIADFVHFEGFVSGDKKIELLNWANLFILPSFNEGLPISILEAMSYKMPIISTPVGGIPEVVDDKNGILVEPGNDEQIFTAIKRYIDNKDIISSQGACSYQKVETYMPEYVLNHLKSIYERLLSKE